MLRADLPVAAEYAAVYEYYALLEAGQLYKRIIRLALDLERGAHELGHLVLGHVKLAGMRAGRTEDLTNLTSRMEAEANCFAAALLISDEDALNAIRTYCELSRAAASLYVCPELLQAKARILSAKGCAVIVPELPSSAAWKRCARKACGC